MTWATRITILRLILVPVFVTLVITYDDTGPDGHPRKSGATPPSPSSLSLRFPMRSTATWPGIGTSAARSGRCSIRSPTSCCCWRRWSRWAWCRSIISAPFRSGFPPSSSAATRSCSAAISSCAIFCQVEIRPHWTGKLSTFFTFLAIAAVLLQAGARTISLLCASGPVPPWSARSFMCGRG